MKVTKLLFLFFLLICQLSKAGQFIEISGEIDWVHFDSEHTNTPVEYPPIHFKCLSGGILWEIDNDFSVNGRTKWCFDGTNVMDTTIITRPAPDAFNHQIKKSFGVSPLSFEEEKSHMQINVTQPLGGHPFGDVGVNLPWLAFCSGNYLKLKDRLIPPPCDDLPHAVDAYGYSDKTETFDDLVGLPRVLDLFTSDELHEKSVNQYFFKLKGETPKKRKGFGDGILKFHYEVVEVTNFMGIHIPLKFNFYQKDWFNGRWYVSFRGRGVVQSITLKSEFTGIIPENGPKTIVDYRLRSEEKFVDGV